MTDRANAICVLELLREYSDEEHILSMHELLSKMDFFYGLKPDRRTVYSAVALLLELGYDISVYEENGMGYYLRSRAFEPSEVLMLTDAVYTFPFLPAAQSEQLIRKLQKLVCVHRRKQYTRLHIERRNSKTDNRQVFWSIDQLDNAIALKKQVQFTYLQYAMDKQLHPRRAKPYTVHPYSMVYTNEHYYLVCRLDGYSNTSFYRIDRMRELLIMDSAADFSKMGKAETDSAVYAFSGKPENIVLYCDNTVLDDVLDRFGTGISIGQLDSERFYARFSAPSGGIRFWALQYLPYVEVVEPAWLREEVISSIQKNKYT